MMIALDIMRLLVQFESTSHHMARAFEERLRDRIFVLEEEISRMRTISRYAVLLS